MITLFRTEQVYALERLKTVMTAHIRSLPEKIAPIGEPLTILRFELPCVSLDVLTWLHNQNTARKIYWAQRDGHFEVGGIGVADSIETHAGLDQRDVFEYIEDRLSPDNPHLRYYGGIAFHDGKVAEEWQSFGRYQFVVPRFELLTTAGQTLFACNIAAKDIKQETVDQICAELATIDFAATTTYRPPPKVSGRRDIPDETQWERIFDSAFGPGGALKWEKIVLARRSVFDFNVYINPSALLKHLKDKTPGCYHFCFQTAATSAFLGASPERLYRREHRHIKTEALAGTGGRGQNEEEEIHLERALLSSRKNTLEHRYVVEDIQKRLGPLCATLSNDARLGLMKLRGGQHLRTRFEGTLKKDIADGRIVEALHPTPAVGGCPAPEVLNAIRELEPFDRGWYAGPIGYVGHDQAEFAVAIRSALVQHDKLSLYAGAGIVEGSTAREEWDEIEAKIGNFIEVFNKK